jgi:hypothetical protein
MYRKFNARNTAGLVPNTAHILQIMLFELWALTYTMYLQLHIFRSQYSTERICDAIGDISTIQCPLYCKHGTKYSAHTPDYAIWIVVPAIYSVITALHIQSSIFNWTYLRCYPRYIDNSMCAILQPWCQYSAQPPVYAMLTVVPDIYNVITVPHLQASIFNWTYLRCYTRYLDNKMSVILQTWCPIQRTSSSFRCVICGHRHIQCIYSSASSGFNIQLNVPALQSQLFRQFNALHTANVVPNIAHILQFTLSKLSSRTYTMYLQLHIFRLQYSTERICAAIGDMSTIRRELYCNLGANTAHSLHFTQCELWSRTYTV